MFLVFNCSYAPGEEENSPDGKMIKKMNRFDIFHS